MDRFKDRSWDRLKDRSGPVQAKRPVFLDRDRTGPDRSIPKPNIKFDKINDDNIDDNDNKTDRDKNKDKAENQGSSILSSIEEDDNKGSKVWNHFDKFVDDRGVLWAKCRYCGYEK